MVAALIVLSLAFAGVAFGYRRGWLSVCQQLVEVKQQREDARGALTTANASNAVLKQQVEKIQAKAQDDLLMQASIANRSMAELRDRASRAYALRDAEVAMHDETRLSLEAARRVIERLTKKKKPAKKKKKVRSR